MTQEQAQIAAKALREAGHYDAADILEENARKQVFQDWYQKLYDNDEQDLY